MNKTLFSSVLVLGLLGAAGGCSVTDRQSTVGHHVDDVTITTRVKARMAKDPAVSTMRVGVETFNGTVQLSGFATSEAEKARAEELARGAPDVKGVRNDILVRSHRAGGPH